MMAPYIPQESLAQLRDQLTETVESYAPESFGSDTVESLVDNLLSVMISWLKDDPFLEG